MGWRLLDSQIADPYFVTAADEVIAQFREAQKVPDTLHFYQRHPPTISLGRTRKIHTDVDLEACEKHQVALVRRPTGGGSIYTDRGCLIYSLSFQPAKTSQYSVSRMFHTICTALAESLALHDISATYKPPNDLLLNGKKISGSAQLRKHNTILVHGTVLVSTDLSLMYKVLRISPEKTVTTLQNECTNPPTIPQLKTSITKAFEHLFNTTMKQAIFTKEERSRIHVLSTRRYQNNAWTMKR